MNTSSTQTTQLQRYAAPAQGQAITMRLLVWLKRIGVGIVVLMAALLGSG